MKRKGMTRLKRLGNSAAKWIAKRRRVGREAYIVILVETETDQDGDAETCVRSDLTPKSLLDALTIAAHQVNDSIARKQPDILSKTRETPQA